MKNLDDFVNEKKYDYHCVIPPFNMQIIRQALEAYKDNDDRKKMKEMEKPDIKGIDDTLELLNKSKIE